MEFSSSDQIRYKGLLLQTYKTFAAFCKNYDIHYYAAGGTMIGAVRHQGFIPWDDDVDVYMKRLDYEKFISLKDQLSGTEYEIIDPHNDGYYCAMAKFSHRNSTIWEFQSIPYVFGAYVDVFVLDYEDGTYNEVVKKRMDFAKKVNLLFVCSNNYPAKVISNCLFRKEFKKTIWYVLQKVVLRRYRSALVKQIIRHPAKTQGKWLVAFTGTSGVKDLFRSEWFANSISYSFEDTFVDIPSGFDEFLTAMFGDYMNLPPVDERVSHHRLFYYNLDRRLTKEEIEQMQVDAI